MRKAKHFLLMAAMLLCSVGASAETLASGSCGENLTWTLTEEGELIIEGIGEMTSTPWQDSYSLNIKKVTINEGVSSIGNYAFNGCSNLTSIDIPESVESIGWTILHGTEWYNNQPDGIVYAANILYDYKGSIPVNTSINIKDGIKYIAPGAFFGNEELSSITLPSSLECIGEQAFYCCTNLTFVNIPENVTLIGYRAFFQCTNLASSIVIPAGVRSIENETFYYCGKLPSISFSEGVTNIGESAFYRCGSLSTIALPQSLRTIGDLAFASCVGLTSISVSGNITSMGKSIFSYCRNLVSVNISDGLETIGTRMFEGCQSLSSFTCYAKTPPVVEYNAFKGISSTAILYVPKSSLYTYETEGWSEYFSRIESLPPVVVVSGTCGDNLTWKLTEEGELIIEGTGAMFDYPSLQNVPWYDYVESIQSVVVKEGVNSIGSRAFACCENLASVSIPEGVVSIGGRAYMDCSGLTSVRIPTSVTKIGMYAFSGCDKITDFYIGNIEWWLDYGVKGFTHEGNTNLFIGDDLLTDLVIPSTANSIPSKAFRNCNSIETVKFDNGVTEIGDRAFQNCSNLISVDIPESMCQIGQDAFEGTALYDNQSEGVVYVGNWLCGYKGEMPEDFELVVQEGTKGIVDYAFEGCTNLIRVTIPESTQYIGEAAFISSGLILATMSEGVKSIAGGAFWGCGSLNDVAIPESVMEVGDEAFAGTAWYGKQPCGVLYLSNWAVGVKTCGDWDLSNISIFEGVKGMAEGVIRYDCQSVIIPESVVYLSRAFELANPSTIVCKALTPPKGVDEKTFERAKNSSTLYVPAASVNAYIADEYWGDFENIKAIDFPVWSLTTEGELIVDGVGTMEDYEYEYTPWYIYHSSIKSVTIKEGIASVGDEAFAYCEELASVSLPNSLLSLGEGAFAECYRLSSVVIPENVTTIGSGAFYSAGLSSIICRSMTPPVIADRTTFYNVSKSIPVYVPLSSVEAYNDADYWNEFTNIQPMPETITINQYGSATYYSEYALDFSEVEGLKAYAATGYKTSTGVITLTRVMTANAGVGLFLKGEPSEYTVPVLESTDENSLNMLVGTLESTEVNSTSSDGLYANFRYTIKDGDETPLFYRVDDGYTLGAGKAYLQIPVAWMPAEAKSISLRFDDGATTDIENDAELENQNSELEIYDLMGRRVSTPQRGSLYLINGKKIIY